MDQVGRTSLASLLYPPMWNGFFVIVTANYPSQRQSQSYSDQTLEIKREEEEKRKKGRKERKAHVTGKHYFHVFKTYFSAKVKQVPTNTVNYFTTFVFLFFLASGNPLGDHFLNPTQKTHRSALINCNLADNSPLLVKKIV